MANEEQQKKIDDIILLQNISQNFPDDYEFHTPTQPVIVKVDEQIYVAMLQREDGKEGAEFNQVALMTPTQLFEMMRALPDAKPDEPGGQAKSVEFTGNKVWQDNTTGHSVPADEYGRVLYNAESGDIVSDNASERSVNKRLQERSGSDDEYKTAVLPNEVIKDGKVTPEDAKLALDSDYKLVEEQINVHSSDSRNKMVSTDLLAREINKINFQVELVAQGKRDADVSLSAAELAQAQNIAVETDFQPRANVVEIPEGHGQGERTPLVIPENPYARQEPVKEFNEASGAAARNAPEVTFVDEVRGNYKDILENDKTDAIKTAEINNEVSGLIRYLSREKNFDGQNDPEFKDELHEAIRDLSALGLNEQAAVLEQYEANVDAGMNRREARSEARDELKQITDQVHSAHLEAQEQEIQGGDAARWDAYKAQEAQDKAANAQRAEEWMGTAFSEINESDELKEFFDASMALHRSQLAGVNDPGAEAAVAEAKAKLHGFVDDLKKEHFPDHVSIEERRAARDLEAAHSDESSDPQVRALQEQLQKVADDLNVGVFKMMEQNGVELSENDSTPYEALAKNALNDVLQEDEIKILLQSDPEGAQNEIANRVMSGLDQTIGDASQSLRDNQELFRDQVSTEIRDVVNSEEFQAGLEAKLEPLREQAQTEAKQGVIDFANDTGAKATEALEAERAKQANPDYQSKYDSYVKSFANFPEIQRDAVQDKLENAGDLTYDQQALLDALKQIAIDKGEVTPEESDPAVPATSSGGGFKP